MQEQIIYGLVSKDACFQTKKNKKIYIFLTSKLSKTGANGCERQNERQNRMGITVLGGNGG